jgi:ClpP class serine protease/membrane associated rhomboid family serine protease
MMPIQNVVPSRYPATITYALIAANCLVFLFQATLNPIEERLFLQAFALIPARYFEILAEGNGSLELADFLPFLTMMFLHGGWLHLILNMWTLWLFGPTLEDRLGHGRFLLFYMLCGLFASFAHVVSSPTSIVPALGASGAIAGVLGCFVRLFPWARIIVLVPVLFVPFFFEIPAVVFAGFWFLVQLFQGAIQLFMPSPGGGVAWWAHIGGFVAGLMPIGRALCTQLPRLLPGRGHLWIQRVGKTIVAQPTRTQVMSVGDIFWIFFMITALQPVIRQRMLEAMRTRKIAQIERERDSRVIMLVHRQETMRLLGFPLVRYIDINDSEEVLRAIQLTDDDVPLDIILHTPGGLVLAALQIARAIREHKAKVTVFVPHYAMSGGTLIALAANEIVMTKHSVLGPIDPQVGQAPAASLIKVVDEKPIGRIDDETLVMADVGRKAIEQLKQAATDLLKGHIPDEKATELAAKLSTGTWTHDYPIFFATARELGLPVSTDMPKRILELMQLYPQPVRSQGGASGVEYLPVPRQREAAREQA